MYLTRAKLHSLIIIIIIIVIIITPGITIIMIVFKLHGRSGVMCKA